MATKPKTVVARETFAAERDDGSTVIVKAGERLPASDPIATSRPELFADPTSTQGEPA